MDTLFPNDFSFMHLFHCKYFLSFFEFNTPNFAEASLADHVLAIKMVSTDFFAFEYEFLLVVFFIEFGEVYFETIFDIFV